MLESCSLFSTESKPHSASELVLCGISSSWWNWFLLHSITTCSLTLYILHLRACLCSLFCKATLLSFFSPLPYPSHKGYVPFYTTIEAMWVMLSDFCHAHCCNLDDVLRFLVCFSLHQAFICYVDAGHAYLINILSYLIFSFPFWHFYLAHFS